MNVTVASTQKIGVITADPIGPGFGLALYNQSKGTTNLVVDHYGSSADRSEDTRTVPLVPAPPIT